MLMQMGIRRAGAFLLALGLAVGAASTSPARAQDAAQAPSREALEEIIREYILKHPEVIVESVRAFQERQQAQARERSAAALVARRADLTQDPASPVGGNSRGDVTVVEFFDYRCGYCRAVAATVRQLLQEDPNVRLVYKEFPILGPESLLAARAALAARVQGKYVAFHEALMGAENPLTLDQILKIAGQVGLDVTRLQSDMEAPEIPAALQRNHQLAQELGIRGTPAFVVGTEMVPGALDLERLKELVARARSGR
jgi:protein-disulfide isomerase